MSDACSYSSTEFQLKLSVQCARAYFRSFCATIATSGAARVFRPTLNRNFHNLEFKITVTKRLVIYLITRFYSVQKDFIRPIGNRLKPACEGAFFLSCVVCRSLIARRVISLNSPRIGFKGRQKPRSVWRALSG